MEKKNGLDVLAELTGISGEVMRSIATSVKANVDKLNACPYHEFKEDTASDPAHRRQYRCIHCDGTINQSQYTWHEKGRRAKPGYYPRS
ncbi:TPA: hypothetical protein ACSTLU_004375 [Serratia fonticola]